MSDDFDALQQALAAEHSVIWGYGEIGAHVDAELLDAVTAADLAHRERRDQIEQVLLEHNLEPVASKPAYSLPTPLVDQASALQLAAQLEDSMAQQWRYCLGKLSTPALRTSSLRYLTEAALAAYQWRRTALGDAATTSAFPGA